MAPEQPSRPPSIPSPIKKRRFAVFLGGFVAFLLGLGGLFYLLNAITSPNVGSEAALAKGEAYDTAIEQAKSEATKGWGHTLNVRMDIHNQYRIVLRMRKSQYEVLANAGALIRFYQPSGEGLEFDVTLKETKPGIYMALETFPNHGSWTAYIAVRQGNDIYRARDRLLIK